MSFFTDALRQPIVQAPLTASLSRIDVAVTAEPPWSGDWDALADEACRALGSPD